MRTTVTIDDDVLAVARALAKRNRTSLGRALSELARRGFRTGAAVAQRKRERESCFRSILMQVPSRTRTSIVP